MRGGGSRSQSARSLSGHEPRFTEVGDASAQTDSLARTLRRRRTKTNSKTDAGERNAPDRKPGWQESNQRPAAEPRGKRSPPQRRSKVLSQQFPIVSWERETWRTRP